MSKAQTYGVSIFLYSIAVAILLIVGMIGISKQIDTYAADTVQKSMAVSAMKATEGLKTIFSSERSYVVEKALYISSAFSGYPQKNLSIWYNDHNADKTPCGVSKVGIDFLPEKYVPRFYNSPNKDCVPSLKWVILKPTFESTLGNMTTLQPSLVNALLRTYGIDLSNAGYAHSVSYYADKGIIYTTWILNTGQLSFDFPNKENKIVTYKTPIMVNLETHTDLFNLYDSMKNFVEDNELDSYLNNPHYSPIPLIIDKDGKKSNTPSEQPFKDLVNFVLSNYPSEPNPCTGFSLSQLSSLDDSYSTSCGVETEVNSSTGLLVVKRYNGDCAGSNNIDDLAMKCVLNYTINNVNKIFNKTVHKDVASYYTNPNIQVNLIHSSDTYSSDIINQVVDDRGFYPGETCVSNNPYPQCYSFVRLSPNDELNISFGNPHAVNSNIHTVNVINLTLRGDFSDLLISWQDSDGMIYNLTGEMPVEEKDMGNYKFIIINIPEVKMAKLFIQNNGSDNVDIAEVNVYTPTDNYKVLFKSFNLTFLNMENLKKDYIAIDIDNGTVAPSDYANPNPRDCSITLQGEVKKYAVTTEGGSCSESDHVCCNGMTCCNEGNSKDGKCYTDCSTCKNAGEECNSVSECCDSSERVCDDRATGSGVKWCLIKTGYYGCRGNNNNCVLGDDCCSNRCCLGDRIVCGSVSNCKENCCTGNYSKNVYGDLVCLGTCSGGGPGPIIE